MATRSTDSIFRSADVRVDTATPRAFRVDRIVAAAFAALAPGLASAQSSDAPAQVVTIQGRASANAAASVTGFADTPLARLPISATVIRASLLDDAAITGLGDLTRLDAGASDAYNPPGYWPQLAVRGFIVDPRFNWRRDGLPINAESVIPLANKQSLELLKGTSGMQAGTSAPGGLVNLVVKRPVTSVSMAQLGWREPGDVAASVDLGRRSGGIGWRVNLDAERLRAPQRATAGDRWSAALAGDIDIGTARLEAEIETSRQSQPSVPGFSLLGGRLPAASSVDPRISLNNQPWSLPVVMRATTGSLRLIVPVATDVDLVAHAMRQRLGSDDRIAFPFGCSSEGNWSAYCSDGTFDLYDFRSDGERRTTDALDVSLRGKAVLGGMRHTFNVGVLASRLRADFNGLAYNPVGIGNVDGSAVVPADPTITDTNTNRHERTTEIHLQDAIELSPRWTAWLGMRHTRLARASVRTDGSQATDYSQGVTTPWVALSAALDARTMAYASWGRGAESDVVPNRAQYVNAGQTLPTATSRQIELGLKHRAGNLDGRVALFDIERPTWSSLFVSDGATADATRGCGVGDPCRRVADGIARHRGVEVEGEWRGGPLVLRASAMALQARRAGASDATRNGLEPTNVPATALKLQGVWNLPAPGLSLLGFVTSEGARSVTPDNRITTGGWTRVDLGLRYAHRIERRDVVWRLGVDNVADTRAWKEAPYQYDHAYLFPLQPRTWHASVQFAL